MYSHPSEPPKALASASFCLSILFFRRRSTSLSRTSGPLTYDRPAGSPIPELWQNVLASTTAGAVNVFATNPLWVVKTRLQIQGFRSIPSPLEPPMKGIVTAPFKYRGTLHALWSILRHEGIAGAYSGLSPSLVGVSHIAIQVPLYEEFKRFAVSRRACQGGCQGGKMEATSAEIVMSSSMAKMIASSVTYPHEVIRSHMHASGRGGFSAFVPICKQVRALSLQGRWWGDCVCMHVASNTDRKGDRRRGMQQTFSCCHELVALELVM